MKIERKGSDIQLSKEEKEEVRQTGIKILKEAGIDILLQEHLEKIRQSFPDAKFQEDPDPSIKDEENKKYIVHPDGTVSTGIEWDHKTRPILEGHREDYDIFTVSVDPKTQTLRLQGEVTHIMSKLVWSVPEGKTILVRVIEGGFRNPERSGQTFFAPTQPHPQNPDLPSHH